MSADTGDDYGLRPNVTTTLEDMMYPGGLQCEGVDGSCRDRLLLVAEVLRLRAEVERLRTQRPEGRVK